MNLKSIAALCALALSACSTIPVDPNYTSALQSAQAQQTAIAQANAQAAQARVEAATACAKADSDIKAAVCALGLAAADRGGSSAPQSVSLPNYQRPPTAGEQAAAFMGAAAPAIGAVSNAWAAVTTAKENGKTTRETAHVNADRETSTVNALSGVALGVSHDAATTAQAQAAHQLPTYQLGPGASIAGGDVTQVGHDQNTGTQQTAGGSIAGHDVNDRHDVTTNCFAGDGAPGGNSGNPVGAGASGAGGAGAAGGSSCH